MMLWPSQPVAGTAQLDATGTWHLFACNNGFTSRGHEFDGGNLYEGDIESGIEVLILFYVSEDLFLFK